MANKITNTQNYQNIADAIRSKNGSSDTYTPAQMPQAILDLGGKDKRMMEILTLRPEDSAEDLVLDLSDLASETGFVWSEIRPSLFYSNNNNMLKEIKLPATIRRIGNNAFYNQSHLTKITTLGNIQRIGTSAFSGCTALKDLDIGLDFTHATDEVEFGETAFQNCTALELDTLPDKAPVRILTNAFNGCTALKISEFPTNYKITLFGTAFKASGIRVKRIPSNVDLSLYTQIFQNCPNLTDLRIDTSMYRTTFSGCPNLTKVWIGNNCSAIRCAAQASWSPFNGCSNLTDIYCEPESQPADWGTTFANIGSGNTATVHWNVTEAEFDAIVNA